MLWFLVALGLAFYVGLTLWLVLSAMFFPYQLDYGEGIVMWFTRQLARGQSIYLPFGESFATANYPPVLLLLGAALYPLFGDTFIWGRWLAFAALAVCVAFVIRFVQSESKSWRAALLASGLFAGSTFVYHWAPLYRVDLPGVAFCLAGIFCVWQWEAGRQSAVKSLNLLTLGFALCFFLLALYTKHSLFLAPAAAILAIFLRNRRAAVIFAFALGVLGGGIFLLLEMFTRGGWSFGIITLNAAVWTERVFVPLAQSFLITYAVVLGLGAWGWWQRVRHRRKFGVMEIYAVAALGALALAGREGAWESYFLEAIAMTCVFAGIASAEWVRRARSVWVLPALLLVQLALFWREHDPRIAQKLFAETRAGNEHVAPLVRAAPGTVISEDLGLLLQNGKPVEYYSFPYSALARAGRWDQRWEIENLRAGRFPLVILLQGSRRDVDNYKNFTRAFVSALDYGYAVTSEDTRYEVYTLAPLEYFSPRARFGNLFDMTGWSLEPDRVRASQELNLTVVWQARDKPAARYTSFAHLEDAQGNVVAQEDHEPQRGAYPTTDWAMGEMVRDTYRLLLPVELAPGEYFLRVGWYDSVTQDRLSADDGSDFITLKEFTIE